MALVGASRLSAILLLVVSVAARSAKSEAAEATPSNEAAPSQLVAELGCPACHVELGIATDLRDRTPALDDAGSRYQPAYLFDYLKSPRQVRRHLGAARMPGFHLSEDEALALALFLSEQKRPPALDLPAGLDEEVAANERVVSEQQFRELLAARECLTCHAYGGAGGSLGPRLDDASARLRTDWMRRFLAAPEAYGVPDGVMPALFLRPGESGVKAEVHPGSTREIGVITDHLARVAEPERQRLERAYAQARARHPEVTSDVGRRVFVALNCAACHRHAEITPWRDAAPDLRLEGRRVREDWLRRYLEKPEAIRPFGARPGSGSRMPDFHLTAREAEQLTDFLIAIGGGAIGSGTETPREEKPAQAGDAAPAAQLTPYEESKARLLLDTRLACLGCHRLDGVGGRIGPNLSNVVARLRPEVVAQMITDPASFAPHSIMPKLPLDPATRDLVAAYLVQRSGSSATDYLSLTEHATVDPGAEGTPRHDYLLYCAPCHGADGWGNGFNTEFLPTPPTRHADPDHLSTRPDDTLFDGIHSGGMILGKSHFMPAWGETLSAERIAGLVDYMRELCQCEAPGWSRASARQDASGTKAGGATGGARLASAGANGRARAAAAKPAPSASRSAPTAPNEPHAWPPAPISAADKGPVLADFAGASECATCHPEQFRQWSGSTHGKAGGRVDDVAIIAPFDGTPLRFRDGVVMPTLTADGRHVFRVRQAGQPKQEIEVAAAVGGGHMLGGGTQSFFTAWPDGSLRMLPFDFIRGESTWFAQKKDLTWEPISEKLALADLEHWPPHRALGNAPGLVNCENCHGSQISVRFDPEQGVYETTFQSLRIECESCHGPGRQHVEWARSSDAGKGADTHIAPLVGLDKDASLRVCLQCHANKSVLDQSYLTGKDFDEHFSLKLPMLSEEPFLPDGRVHGFGYQENHLFSGCYVDGSMVCTDCHDPHTQTYRDVFGAPLPGRFDDRQCTGCHASKAIDLERHTHHPAGSDGSRCTSCHMPYLQHQAVGELLRFARSDHTISIPRPAFDASIGIEGACRQCHPERSVEWLEAKTEEWWGPIKPHPAMVESVLAAEKISDRGAAAEILLAPDEKHTMAQFMGLAIFLRTYLAPDMTDLEPAVRAKLEALAESPDLDIAAASLAALHLAAGNDPSVQAFLADQLTRRKPQEIALRRRWARALAELSRQWEAAGRHQEAEIARSRVSLIRPTAPAPGSGGAKAPSDAGPVVPGA